MDDGRMVSAGCYGPGFQDVMNGDFVILVIGDLTCKRTICCI